jgi:hypothetical protein
MENFFPAQVDMILIMGLVNFKFQRQLTKYMETNHRLNGLLKNMEINMHSKMLLLRLILADATSVGPIST